MHNNKDTQRQTYYIHTHTYTHLQINSRDEGRVYNSFGTSSSGMRGTGAVDFSTVYTIVSTLYTTHYSTYRVPTINHSESHKRPQQTVRLIRFWPDHYTVLEIRIRNWMAVSLIYRIFYRLLIAVPLKMYRKCGQLNWILVRQMLKLVRKWPMADCYFSHCYISR